MSAKSDKAKCPKTAQTNDEKAKAEVQEQSELMQSSGLESLQHIAATPGMFTRADVPALQRTIGNRANTRLIQATDLCITYAKLNRVIMTRINTATGY